MNFEKRDKWIDIIFFIILLTAMSVVTLVLFHRQTLGSPETGYHSDMKAYILEMQGLDSGYNFPYPVLFKFAAFINLFCNPEFSMALATMLLNSLSLIFIKVYFNKIVKNDLSKALCKNRWMSGIAISIIATSLFFISMLFPIGNIFYLPGIKFNYLGVFTANPFQNATYMAARPFAILSFFSFAGLLQSYEQKVGGREYIFFSFSLLMATMTKPSFTIVLVGTAGLIMLYRLIKSRFANFIPTLKLALCFIPTFIDLLYQYKGVFVPNEGEEGGIGLCFGEVWGYYCDNIPLAVCLAVGFPILVLILNYRELKINTEYRFSWQIYLMGFSMAFILYEKGFRKPDFNFSWGYMYGIFFCFVGALLILIKKTAECFETSQNEKTQERMRNKCLVVLQWLAYLAHLICGLYYFSIFFRGGMYY